MASVSFLKFCCCLFSLRVVWKERDEKHNTNASSSELSWVYKVDVAERKSRNWVLGNCVEKSLQKVSKIVKLLHSLSSSSSSRCFVTFLYILNHSHTTQTLSFFFYFIYFFNVDCSFHNLSMVICIQVECWWWKKKWKVSAMKDLLRTFKWREKFFVFNLKTL